MSVDEKTSRSATGSMTPTSDEKDRSVLTETKDVGPGSGSGVNVPSTIDEKKLVRKIDWVLIPWLSFLYLVAFLDRSSIGNAKVRRLVLLCMFCIIADVTRSCITWKPTCTLRTLSTLSACQYSSFRMRFWM